MPNTTAIENRMGVAALIFLLLIMFSKL